MICTTMLILPVGKYWLQGSESAITGLWQEGGNHSPTSFEESGETPALFAQVKEWLDVYFQGKNPGAALPCQPQGTAFQQSVWALLEEIPYGKTRSYGDLAKALGSSPRAVGGAVGRNPISIIIPCHRVIGANDTLTGYAGGLDAKTALLRLEGLSVDGKVQRG